MFVHSPQPNHPNHHPKMAQEQGDRDEAIRWYKSAADAGHVEAQFELANAMMADGDPDSRADATATADATTDAMVLMVAAAQGGDARAQHFMFEALSAQSVALAVEMEGLKVQEGLNSKAQPQGAGADGAGGAGGSEGGVEGGAEGGAEGADGRDARGARLKLAHRLQEARLASRRLKVSGTTTSRRSSIFSDYGPLTLILTLAPCPTLALSSPRRLIT